MVIARARRECRVVGVRRRQKARLALGELGAAASSAETVFLALFHAAIASQKSRMAQQIVQLGIEGPQSAGQPELAGAGLTGDTAAVDFDGDIDGGEFAGLVEGVEHLKAIFFGGEIILDATAVDFNFSRAGFDADAGHGLLATAGGDGLIGSLRGGSGGHFQVVSSQLSVASRTARPATITWRRALSVRVSGIGVDARCPDRP